MIATEAETFTCPTHGQYTVRRDRLYARDSHCAACEAEAREQERAWRAEHARWKRACASGIPSRFQHAALSTWDANTQGRTAALRIARAWCDDIANGSAIDGNGLTLIGPPGVGKTHLAAGLLIDLLQRTGLHVGYAQWLDVLDQLKASAAQRTDGAAKLLDWLKGLDVLVLDELGVRVGTEFDQAALFSIIDQRYRDELPTVICTNVPPDSAVAMLGERVVDRLREVNAPVPLSGASRRELGRRQERGPDPITKPPMQIHVPDCLHGHLRQRLVEFR